MSEQSVSELSSFLKTKAKKVRDIEAEAADALHGRGDQEAYRSLMSAKAELLAGLAAEAEPLVEKLPPPLADAVADRLGRFSSSARNSLSIGSVFFMSALLYPEDHQENDPNDLEAFIDSL